MLQDCLQEPDVQNDLATRDHRCCHRSCPDIGIGASDRRFDKTSLLDKSGEHPLDLAAAERRFLVIASVFAMAPRVLLLDEAQMGLDRVWTRRPEDILVTERLAGKSIVMICHNMDFVERNADTVLALGGHA